MRYFNTTGPCDEAEHYMLPAAERLEDARLLIERGRYFAVHAPRQTGKTTSLRALARELNATGRWAALHFSCERGATTGDDIREAQRAVLDAIRDAAVVLPPELRPPARWPQDVGKTGRLITGLRAWSAACPRPVVLLMDEIDALTGDGLRHVLHQLREGHQFSRETPFVHSVVLCGLRDVRDDKEAAGGHADRFRSASRLGEACEPSERPSNIKLSRCGWVISPTRRSGFSMDSTPGRPGRSSPMRRSPARSR